MIMSDAMAFVISCAIALIGIILTKIGFKNSIESSWYIIIGGLFIAIGIFCMLVYGFETF